MRLKSFGVFTEEAFGLKAVKKPAFRLEAVDKLLFSLVSLPLTLLPLAKADLWVSQCETVRWEVAPLGDGGVYVEIFIIKTPQSLRDSSPNRGATTPQSLRDSSPNRGATTPQSLRDSSPNSGANTVRPYE
ncbi:MAG: hypothetical protein MR413_07610 [Clostridia bacterium]|nr:hypothetical protein [Clostridia bacterium]